jgi:hypothetical protein
MASAVDKTVGMFGHFGIGQQARQFDERGSAMARQVSVRYVDDLDGSDASGPVGFSLDGNSYTIDLSEANASKLREVLAPFVSAARRGGRSPRRSSGAVVRSGGASRSREETQAIRSWLRDNGYTVKDRGRVPSELIAAYETHTAAPSATDHVPASKSSKRRKANNVEFSGG